MSWQDDAMIEQERADALEHMGEAEWRDMYDDVSPDYEYDILKTNDPDGKEWEKMLEREREKWKNRGYTMTIGKEVDKKDEI